MACQTILTVETCDDPATHLMLNSLYHDDKFRGFEIQHCFTEGASTSEELYEILEQAVEKYQPSVLLIHTGLEFHRRISAFEHALRKLKLHSTHLKIGIQDRANQDKTILWLISNDKNTKSLERRFFRIKR